MPLSDHRDEAGQIDRRSALQLIGGALGALLLPACGRAGAATSGMIPHPVTPAAEIGPYFTDDSAPACNRANILANIDGTDPQSGIPLTLKVFVYDTQDGDAPMSGVRVDIWHCNALGAYSDEPAFETTGQSWLRGYQLTDADGAVTFATILPGWEDGRATHIHVRARSKYGSASTATDSSDTTQFFFVESVLDAIYATVAPYNIRGRDPTTNAADRVYASQTHAETEVALVGDPTTGYAASLSLYLPITDR